MEPTSRFMLKDKHIVITGASSGIGRETAILCSELGAKVTIVARNKERLESTLSSMKGDQHLVVIFDVTTHERIAGCVSDFVASEGKIDGFVHSAGIRKTLPQRASKPEFLLNTLSVNLVAAFEFVRVLSKKANSNNSASFVLISSVMGVVGEVGLSSYCASKGALISGSKALALELAPRKQRINCISPAMVKTELLEREFNILSEKAISNTLSKHPLGFGSPADVANAAAFLLSDASEWITGTNLIVDGGYSAS